MLQFFFASGLGLAAGAWSIGGLDMKRVTSDQQATGIFNGFKDWSCTVSSQNLHSDSDSDSERNFESDSERNFDSDFNRQ